MIKLSFDIKTVKGGDTLKKLIKHLEGFKKEIALYRIGWGIILRNLIKHTVDAKERGTLWTTALKCGLDLGSNVAMNTERIPNAKTINTTEYAKGLREFVIPINNRLVVTSHVDDPNRLFADIMADAKSQSRGTGAALAKLVNQMMAKIGLKPEGGNSGSIR